MLRKLDVTLAGTLIALGCVHNFVAAPLTYPELTARALWFVSAGLALWYAGFLNLLRIRLAPHRLAAGLALLANLTLLVFVLTYAALRGNWLAPEAILLMVTVAGTCGCSWRHWRSSPV
jgi:hypothetical protein